MCVLVVGGGWSQILFSSWQRTTLYNSQFSWRQYLCAWKSPYRHMLCTTLSQTFPWYCLWNSSSAIIPITSLTPTERQLTWFSSFCNCSASSSVSSLILGSPASSSLFFLSASSLSFASLAFFSAFFFSFSNCSFFSFWASLWCLRKLDNTSWKIMTEHTDYSLLC